MDKTESKLQIKPIIEGGKIVYIEVGYEPLPLRAPIPLERFSDLISKLEALSEYIDFGGESGWTEDELEIFTYIITNKAREFFQILASDGGWVSRETVQEKMHIKGRALAGILSSPGQYFSRNRKDPIYESDKRREEGDEKENYYYRIKPEYLDSLRDVLDIV